MFRNDEHGLDPVRKLYETLKAHYEPTKPAATAVVNVTVDTEALEEAIETLEEAIETLDDLVADQASVGQRMVASACEEDTIALQRVMARWSAMAFERRSEGS